jgi:hypothetical protein
VVPELSPSANARASNQDCCTAHKPDRARSDLLTRIAGEISDLEREIAFLDALCRPYEQCSLAY